MVCLLFIIFATISVGSAEEIVDEINETVNHTHSSVSEVISNDVTSGTFTELNDLIQSASDGQTIYLYKDYKYVDSDSAYIYGIPIHHNIIINGQGHTINGSDKARIFLVGATSTGHYPNHSPVDYVSLENINFVNARNTNINFTSNGNAAKNYAFGAVEFYGNGRIVNCNFINNYAFCAGAMAIGFGNNINIIGCNFINNTGFGQGGGAIRLRTQVNGLTISDSLFENNYGDTYGGAVHSDMGYENDACTIINTIFINNTARLGGGGLFFETPNANLINSTFKYNNAPLGGGVYWNGYSGDVEGSIFIGNNATVDNDSKGGGIFCSGRSTTHITTSKFINNTATNGGGIYFDQSEGAAIYDCSFDGNTVIEDGGAIYCAGQFFVLNNSNFTNDIAHRDGGSTYFDVGAYVNNCAFEDEHADRNGGGMYVYSKIHGEPPAGVELGVFYSNFTRCSAGNNGGAGYVFTDYGVVKNSILINCTADNVGGGGYISGNYGKLIDSKLLDNKANYGAGVYWEGNNGTLLNSEISGNLALNGNGGGVFWVGNNGNLTGSNFSNNHAIVTGPNTDLSIGNGGSLLWLGSNGTITNSSFEKSSVTNAGGAIYIGGNNTHIITSQFQRLNATYGGGIYINGNDVNITSSNFSYGEAAYGGVIFINGINTIVTNSSLEYCHSRIAGGSIYVEGDIATIEKSDFHYSYSEQSGGAIYIHGEHVLITNSNFTYNNASTNSGGSIYVDGSDTNITNSTFQYGAAKYGGVIYINGSNTNILRSNFSYNGAIPELLVNDTAGGTIYIAGDNTVISESNIMMTNAGNGGAVYIEGNNTNITNSYFGTIFARNDGGAVYIGGLNSLISNSTFEYLNATRGGGVYIAGNSTNITNSTFRYATCKEGGAIYVNGSNSSISKSNFLRNGVNLQFDINETRGGSIFIEGHNTLVSDSNFTYCSAGDGGAMFITGDNTNITNSNFKFATVANNGGLVYVGGTNTTITDSTFSFSNATNGGAIYLNGTDTNINANISYCFAKGGNGGGIYIEGDNNNITGTNFTITNTIGGNGGVIYAGGDNLTISDCHSNMTNAIRTGPGNIGNGGVIYISGEGVTITDSTFTRFNATDNGGGLYVEGNNVNVTKSSFSQGEANYGGSIYINGNNTIIENSNLTYCHARINGGAFYVNGNNTIITDSNLKYSYAEHSGGAAYINGENNLITNSNLTLNNASGAYGGSIYINGDKNNITNSSFERCTSTKGGAIYINGKEAHILDSTFAQNGINPSTPTTTDTAGGTIYIAGDDALISGDDFRRSNAKNGGMIYVEGNNANISSSNFTQSSANYNGGAIYVAGENATIVDSTFSLHNATNGSAVYISGYNADIISSNFTGTVSVGGDGGAIYVGGDKADIINSKFNSTRVINGNGGAIYVAGDNSNIFNSNFNIGASINAGYKGGNGGMIYISGENVTITDSNFSKSNASLAGGAVYIAGDNAIIDNSYLEYSESERGGAIYIKGTNATLSNSNSTYAYARRNGGSIYINGDKTTILNSKLDYSYSERYGGAIFVNGTNTTISNSYLLHNYVVNLSGGSVYINGNNTYINGTIFQNGNATLSGGSVYINGNNTYINDSVFKFSVAGNGGAIYIAGEKTLISNSSFLQNNVSASTGNGGTIYIAGNETHIDTSNFERSNANYGGIIYINGNKANITNSNFTKSYAYSNGGAIYVNGANATINNSKFSLHNATTAGAIYVKGENTLISDSEFNKSVASVDGGAVYLGGNNTKIYNSTFNENFASNGGGAVYNNGGTATIISSNFTNNTVKSTTSRGGAIFWKGGSSNDLILDCYFENNSALDTNHAKGALGGAIYWEHGSTPTTNSSIINSTFVNNTSEHHGGAIDWFNANNGTIENCVFIENYAVHDGGALYIGDDGSNGENLTINNSIFIKNHAGVKGGALSMQFYNSKVINCNFTDNYASGAGSVYMNNVKANHTQYINCNFIGSYTTTDNGGVAIINVPYIDFINCTFENCTVPSRMQGAGIYFNNKAIYSNVIDSNFTNCSNARYGGAISINARNINISGSNFDINTAVDEGGAIYVGAINTLIEKSSFNNNSASDGGAICIIATGNNIIDSTFNYNKAEEIGGSIYISRANDQNLTNLTIANSTAIYGGGLYVDRASSVYIISSFISDNLADEGAGIYLDSVADNIIVDTSITNNNATKGSGIYTFSSDYSLYNVILLDNQAHGNEFINEAIKMAENGTYYVTATFLGYDNRLNGIWDESSDPFLYSNVTYWGANGTTVTDIVPDLSDMEMGQNVTLKRYNSAGTLINTDVVVTNETGDFIYEFEDDGDTLVSFTMNHLTDNYYTEINKDVTIKPTRVTIKIEDINLGENATVNVTLTDADGNPLSGTVRVIINDSNKNFTITVTDGKGSQTGVSGLSAGTHNATVTYEGNTEYLGSTNSTTFNVKAALDLTINKTVDKTLVNVSDIVEFTITVTNKGPSNATGVNVTDILDEKLEYINSTASQGTYNQTTHIWTIGNITSGLSVNIKIKAKVLTNGTIPNFANVTSIENDTNTSNNNDSSDNITAKPKVNLTIIKTANITNATVGDTVNFTITVYNNGPSNATNVQITDTLDNGFSYVTANGTPTGDRTITWPIGNLENGTNATVWLIVKILTNGTFTNFATVNSTEDPTGNKSNETNITVTPYVNLTITKESNTTNASVGDIVRFNLTIFNTGLSNATNIQVSDNLSSGFTFVNANGTYTKTGQNIIWTIPHIENGTNTTIWVDVKVLTNGTFTNFATVNSTEDPTGNKSNETNVTVNPKVNLTIIKTVNVTNATVGDTVNFTITVYNNGPSNATNIEITDTLNDAFEWISDSRATLTTNTLKWTISSLANGTNTSVWVTVKLLTNGTYPNIAKVNCSENTTETPSNETNVTITPNVNLTIIKTANVTNVTVGDFVNFTITVYNNGLSNATNVEIVDVLDNAFSIEDENGTPNVDTQTVKWTINNLENGTNATFWIKVKVLTNGTFSNVATVNSTEDPKGNTSNVTNITVNSDVKFLIIKTVNATNVSAGDIVNFTITICNIGLSNATRVQLLDVLNPAFRFIDSLGAILINSTLMWGSGSEYLHPGQNITVWFTTQVMSTGTFSNVARGVSAENPTGNISNEVNVTAKANVNLSITKNVDIASVSVGDIVNYTLTVYNTGFSNATNVEVFDELAKGLDFVDSNIRPRYNDGQNITWVISNVENGTNTTIWLTVKVMEAGNFTNFATVNSTENITPNKSNEVNITVGPYVNLTITKIANVTGNVSVGDIVNFTITAYNIGLSNATNVEIIDDLDPAFLRVDDSGANSTGQRYVWKINNLENGTNTTVWITVKVMTNGTFSNFAVVNSSEIPRGNTSNITNITATPKVNLTVTKTANASNVTVGDIVRFKILIYNNGPSNATNIEIKDVLNKSFEFVGSYGGVLPDSNGKIVWTIPIIPNGTSSNVWVDVKVLNNGTFSNIATANCSENKTDIPSNETNVTVTPNVNLTIIKTANITTVNVNDTINYTITVYNNGLSNATNVNITDLLPDELVYVNSGGVVTGTIDNLTNGTKIVKWTIPTLSNGTNASVWLIVRVITNGTFTNVAFANSDENDTNKTNETNISAVPVVDLVINKTVNQTLVNVSDFVEFTITVTNCGPSNATGVNVTDVLDSHLRYDDSTPSQGTYDKDTHIWTIGNITTGLTVNLTIRAEVISNGTIPNFAFVTSNENDTNTSNNNDSSDNITSNSKVNLTVIKTANVTGNITVGDSVNYTITIINYGPSNATGVEITDNLVDGLEFITSNVTPTKVGQKLTWNIGNLANGTNATVWLIVKVNRNGTFVNMATVNSTEDPKGNTSNETNVTVTPNVNLTIIKIANISNVKVDDIVNFTITVYNNGLSNATNVNITDLLPDELVYVNSGGIVTGTPDVLDNGTKIVKWTIPVLYNGTNASVWVTVNVTAIGTFTNVAFANSDENDTNKTNETNISAKPAVDLVINKTVNQTLVNVSDVVEFTITVTNRGPSNATDVNVTDVLDGRLQYINSTASQGTYSETTHLWTIGNITSGLTVNLTIRAKVIANGTIPNFAFVTSNETDTNTSNNNDSSDNITANPVVNLSIVKVANVTGNVTVGDNVQFTITVTNYGPSNATNVQITDTLDSHFGFVSANASGVPNVNTVTWTIPLLANGSNVSVNVIVKVLSNGTFTNVAVVNSTENLAGNKSNETNVTANPNVNLSIVKVANVTGNVTVGDFVNFTITISNNGLSNATNVEIIDKLDEAFELVSATEDKTLNADGNLVWNIGKLNNGSNASVWVTVKVVTNGTFTNVAVVNSSEDPEGKKSNETNVTVTPSVNLTITKTSNVTEGQNVSVGDLIKFTITVKNNGPSNATDVKVTDVLSEAFDYDSSTVAPYSVDGRTYVWRFDKLEVNEEKTIEVIVKAKLNGFYSNVAIVNSSESENKTSNETPVIILPAVNLSVIKTANVTKAALNDTVNFTIVVTNNGPSAAHNVTLIDIIPSGMEYLESGSNITGVSGTPSTVSGRTNVTWVIDELPNGAKALVWVTVKAFESGTLKNVVIANSSENKTGTSNETEVNVSSLVDLSITKTVSKTSVYVGDKIVYTITVKNIGSVDATGVIVNENLKGTVRLVSATASVGTYNNGLRVWNISDLASGDVATLSLTFEVLKVETIENSVVVRANENDTNTSNNNDTSEKVKVNTLPTPISLETHNITYTEEETLTVTLPSAATGYVDITVNDTVYTNQLIVDGVVVLVIPDLAGGDYDVSVEYGGDGVYSQASTKGTFTVFPLTPDINIEVVDIFYGEVEVLNVTVTAPGTVNITVNGKTISYVPLNHSVTSDDALEDKDLVYKSNFGLSKRVILALTYDGKTTWNLINLPVGTYPVFAVYNGNENYTTVNATGEFEVKPLASWVSGSADDIYVGENAIINLSVTPNATGNITVTIENLNYTTNIINGKAQLTIPGLKAGQKQVQITYNGDNIYQPSQNTTTFTVKKILPPITIDTQDIYVGDNETITITLPTDATGNVTITINGQNYTSPLTNGQATFTIENLTKGTYTVDVTYTGDDKYLPTNTTGTFKVQEKQNNHTKPHTTPTNIGLTQYPTGNPILALLIALLTIGITTRRKNKK